ncbi:hypothetical protein FA15DRAFT_669637 [Coprinopsis marcescibilis]|uniref:Uncharacterized protein n=1 Tax=Coprinopsis marcescibilis TaxID=230819 RepID=A0A5C3KVF2_COPMA|nr:hypothetical protein FA15DRAFT_669637 [Coprinopsis marcescibilis]
MSPIQAFLKLAGQVLDVPRRYVNREIDYPSVAPNLQANTLFHQLLDPDIEAGDVSTIGKGLPPGKAKRWREVPVDSKTDFTIAAREIKDVQKTNSGAYSGGPCVAVTTFGGITPLCSTSSLPKPTMTVWRTNNPDRAVSANMGGGTNPIDGRKMLHTMNP